MKRTLDPGLDDLRGLVQQMGERSTAILDKALRGAFELDRGAASEVAYDDLAIDQLDVDIDAQVLRVLALQAPVASDLREVVSIKMMASDLERVGDIARNIAKIAVRLSASGTALDHPPLVALAGDAKALLARALDCCARADADAARAIIEEDDRIDAAQDRIVEQAVASITEQPEQASKLIDVIFIAKALERVADHATNIAEDLILAVEARNVKHADKLEGG